MRAACFCAHQRTKDGKAHTYWTLVETVRTPDGPRQRTLCYLGELNGSAQALWLKTIEVFNAQGESRQLKLFPADAPVPEDDPNVARVLLDRVRVERTRRFGECFLGWELWRRLPLDGFWEALLDRPEDEADVPWSRVAALLAIKKEQDTDAFCFQEVYDEMKQLARHTLSGYKEVEQYKYVTDDDSFPQATYIKRNIPLLLSGTIMEDEEGVGLGLYTQIRFGQRNLYLCKFHGMSRPVDKLDDPERLRQSQRLVNFFKDKDSSKIIGGDFNVFPETKSVRMFQENSYKDLIKEFNIATTRNQLSWETYPDNKQYYSDYVFVSPDIKIKNFSVPNIEISNYLRLILEI